MCNTCLYNKNCQFLAKHQKTIVDSCTAYKDATNIVEVVICKDCQHYIDGCCYVSNRTNKGLYPRVNIHSRNENDFCSYGERRTEDD